MNGPANLNHCSGLIPQIPASAADLGFSFVRHHDSIPNWYQGFKAQKERETTRCGLRKNGERDLDYKNASTLLTWSNRSGDLFTVGHTPLAADLKIVWGTV